MIVMWRLGFVLVGIAVAFVAVEITLRLVDAVPEVANPLYSFHDSDPVLGWRGRPDVHLRFRRPQFDVEVRHDAQGWRLAEPPPPANPQRRVLVLGDSFTWGWGVPQGAVYTDQLQRALPDVAIANRGVNAYGTGQELLLLPQELAAGDYDTVVVQVFFNDLVDNTESKSGRRPLFHLDGDRLVEPSGALRPLTSPVRQWFKDHSRTFLLLDFTTRALGGGNEAATPLRPAADASPLADPDQVRGAALAARLLEAVITVARAHGATTVIAYAPHRLELTATDTAPPLVQAAHLVARRAAEQGGAVWVDLTQPLADAARSGEPVLFDGDEHWTPRGHVVVADTLLEPVRSR